MTFWPVWALFRYWCHVCCIRFRRVNLIVDGRQMVSLVSVHGRGSLFDVYILYSLLHFSLVPVEFMGQYFGVLCGHWVSCDPTIISYSCWFIQVHMFFESLAECQIIPQKSEATHVTPVREQGPELMGWNVVLIFDIKLQSKSNYTTINHSWSHEQYIQYFNVVVPSKQGTISEPVGMCHTGS